MTVTIGRNSVPVDGPSWTIGGLTLGAGRYPLAVERDVMAMAAQLVPGIITVTPHARYYSLHALVAAEIQAKYLPVDQAQDLLRRCEVVLASATHAHHGGHPTSLGKAHGADALARQLNDGVVGMQTASAASSSGYVRNQWGFWGVYAGPETTSGILRQGRRPGSLCDETAARGALGDVLGFASREELSVKELAGYEHLCLCGAVGAADGPWLAQVFCGVSVAEDVAVTARDRRDSIRLIARILQTHDVRWLGRDVGVVLAFGDFLTTDYVAREIDIGAAWRGVVLRNYAVGAWRRLWAWLVDQVDGAVLADTVADKFVDGWPASTVADFVADLPQTMGPNGVPVAAEPAIRDDPHSWGLPLREVSVLALAAQRVSELEGRVRDAFTGSHTTEFAPVWLQRRFADAADTSMRDFGRDLVRDMVSRARRIALEKTQRRADGTLWMPARLRELDGGWLFRLSGEGSGDVSLRIDQLVSVLTGVGVFEQVGGRWSVTPTGEALLEQR